MLQFISLGKDILGHMTAVQSERVLWLLLQNITFLQISSGFVPPPLSLRQL